MKIMSLDRFLPPESNLLECRFNLICYQLAQVTASLRNRSAVIPPGRKIHSKYKFPSGNGDFIAKRAGIESGAPWWEIVTGAGVEGAGPSERRIIKL